MNANKPIALNRQILASQLHRAKRNANNANSEAYNLAFDAINELTTAKMHFNKQVFNYLLEKTFEKFRDSNNVKYYIPKRWLVAQFERILMSSTKDAKLHDSLYGTMLLAYFTNPFDFEERTAKVFYDFFWKHNNFKVEIFDKPKIFSDYTINHQHAIKTHFFKNKKFTNFLIAKMISNATIKGTKEVISSILWNAIDKFLKSKDPRYQKRVGSALYDWAKNKFNYEQAKQLGLTKVYDLYFKINDTTTKQAILNFSQQAFETRFRKEITSQLSTNGLERTPLTQVVHYYLLIDMIKWRFFTPVARGEFKDAKRIVDIYNNQSNPSARNLNLVNSLGSFLAGLKQQIAKFGFSIKAKDKTYGLAFEKNEPWDLLTPTDNTRSRFDFRFRFWYKTSYVNFLPDQPGGDVFKFKFPIELNLSDFEKAQNIIKKFASDKVSWSQGYMEQPLWTEKDLVDWISDFSNVGDFRKFITPKRKLESTFEKALSPGEWLRFANANLQEIDFSIIKSSNFIFKVTPVIVFKVNSQAFQKQSSNANERTPNYFGSVKVHLRLGQYLKNYKTGDLPVKEIDLEIKNESKVLSMLDLAHNKIRDKFPNFLTFYNRNQFDLFWLNEFIDEQGNSVTKLKGGKEVFKYRSNFKLLYDFAINLAKKINREYRNDFQITEELSLQDNTDKTPGKKITFGLTFFDSLLGKEKHYKRILYTNAMKSFGTIKSGEFKNREGIDVQLIKKFSKAKPLITPDYKEPVVNKPIPKDFTFLVGTQKYTIADIDKEFMSAGFVVPKRKSIIVRQTSENQKEASKYLNFFYQIIWYKFSKGNGFFSFASFKINIDFKGVTPAEIEKGYQDIIKKIPSEKKVDLTKDINTIFSQLKKEGTNNWRTNVSLSEYNQVIRNAISRLPDYDTIKKIEEVYGGQAPQKVLNKLSDPQYLEIIKEILNQRDHFSLKNLKKILESETILKFLKQQGKAKIKDLITKTLKVTKNVKYSYFGSAIGFGILSLLAGATSIRTLRLQSKSKIVSTKFKRSRYISILSLGASVISALASSALMLIFFIEKGGF